MKEAKYTISILSAVVAITISILAAVGMLVGYQPNWLTLSLTSWSDGQHPAMRPVSIIICITCSVMAILMSKPAGCYLREIIITGCSAFVSGVVVTNLIWLSFVSTSIRHNPIIITSLAFLLVAAAGAARGVFRTDRSIWFSRGAGIIGIITIYGYLFGISGLHGGPAMAIPTATCLVLIAIAADLRHTTIEAITKRKCTKRCTQ